MSVRIDGEVESRSVVESRSEPPTLRIRIPDLSPADRGDTGRPTPKRRHISAYDAETTKPTDDTVKRIAEACGCWFGAEFFAFAL